MDFQGAASNEGGTTGGSVAESSDEEEPSSSLKQNTDVEDVLDNFRENWKRELATSKCEHKIVQNKDSSKEQEDVESVAKQFFLKGEEMERKGQFYEAIQFYRRAVQLVPDIEFRVNSKTKNHIDSNVNENKEVPEGNSDSDQDSEDENSDERFENDDVIKDLLSHIQKKVNKAGMIFVQKNEQKEVHISALPMEIILYILRWVVSSDLDMRSLEMCSNTCRGFFVCCRDSEIWKLACTRAWGLNFGILPSGFSSWRQMFIERAHLQFNGCYISKTTYIRPGENSFQDQFYRPWHIVTYYRYLRFFPEGLVLMLTTADEPAQCVGLLKYRTVKSPAILSGRFRLQDDKVILIVHRNEIKNNSVNKRNRKKDSGQNDPQQTFHLEMQIQSYRKKKYIQLAWTTYSVYTRNKNGTESTNRFDLIGNRFPPLWFSRVKSYTSESYNPL